MGIAAGIGILMQERPADWMWTRVVGDLLDFGSLASAANSSGSSAGRRSTRASNAAVITIAGA